MAVRWDNVISITLVKSNNADFLIRSASSQLSSFQIFLMGLGGLRSQPNPYLKFGSTGNRTRDLMVRSQTR